MRPFTQVLFSAALAASVFAADGKPRPASAKPLPVSVPAAAAPAAQAAPALPASSACRAVIEAIHAGSIDPEPFLAAAACLRHEDSAEGRSGRVLPDARLLPRLPDNGNWYLSYLERFVSHRDAVRAVGMAYLSEAYLGGGNGASGGTSVAPQIWRLAGEAYAASGLTYRAALAHLKQLEYDSSQTGYLQFQLESLIRSAGSDISAPRLLDSLAQGYGPRGPAVSQALEQLCWTYRHYAGACRQALEQLSQRDPGPSPVFDKVNRFLSLGYWDYAAGLLDKYPWRRAAKPWPAMGRGLFLRAHYQLQDWAGIAAETEAAPAGKAGGGEEEFIACAALIRLGRPQQALDRLDHAGAPTLEAPWGFRCRLLKAQAQMALGRFKEAALALTQLKKDPERRESTGPILFWQGLLALQQSRFGAAESLLVLASAYTGDEEAQRALDLRFWLLLDTADAARVPFFLGLPEAPRPPPQRLAFMEQVPEGSPLWPFARLEKAQILLQLGRGDSARAALEQVARSGSDRVAAFGAEAKAAFLQENTPGGRAAALARYEDLLVKYQQGVVPEFSRGRLRALKRAPEGSDNAK
jgi:hypothetical protein